MPGEIIRIRRALVSVSDKSGLTDLARALQGLDVEILSSGGTYAHLSEAGIRSTEISAYTGAKEILGGRVKTLHPKIYAGILAVRDDPAHRTTLQDQNFPEIDLVVVNLYPFEETVARPNADESEVIENIDIGGPSLLRASAKNYRYVTVLTDPSQYEGLIDELKKHDGGTALEFRRNCAMAAFGRTCAYDASIENFFEKTSQKKAPSRYVALRQELELRYGENPHQYAGYFVPSADKRIPIAERVLQGKPLSYNNLLDVHAGVRLMRDIHAPHAATILKHTNPCGAATSTQSLLEAYRRALECDPKSAFGGIVIFNGTVEEDLALECDKVFTEIILATRFSPAARNIFAKKKNLRLLQGSIEEMIDAEAEEIRKCLNGYLIQQSDPTIEGAPEGKVVTRRSPSEEESRALSLAMSVVKHVTSNAIVISNQDQTVGIGAGQMSRVDAFHIAVRKRSESGLSGDALASDAFFPFRDVVDEAARAGIRAIIQPGGSVRDQEVIEACNENDIAMIFTGVRHFRH